MSREIVQDIGIGVSAGAIAGGNIAVIAALEVPVEEIVMNPQTIVITALATGIVVERAIRAWNRFTRQDSQSEQ